MLLCPMCGDDDLVAVRIPALEQLGAHCPVCDSYWPRGVPIRLRFHERLSEVLTRHGLSRQQVLGDPGDWLFDAYRDSRTFPHLCPACQEDDLEIMLVVPLRARIQVCPHCDACWNEAVRPNRRDHGLVGVYLQWQGLTQDDLIEATMPVRQDPPGQTA